MGDVDIPFPLYRKTSGWYKEQAVIQDNFRAGILVNRVGILLLPMRYKCGTELE